MKILIATGIYPPDIGGPATYSKLLKDELPASGIDVEVLSFGEVRALPKIIRHFAYFLKVLKLGRGIDIIYAQDPVSVGLPALLAARILRKSFIVKVVGDYAWEQFQQKKGVSFVTLEDFQSMKVDFMSGLRRKIERYVGRKSDSIVVPSIYLKKIVMMWGVKEEKIKVIYNTFALKDVMGSKEELREKFGFDGNIIFSVGRLVPWKGFELLIEIMKDMTGIKLFIAGSGPMKEELGKKIKDLNLNDRVNILGRLEQNDLLERVKASDIFVLNTGYEGLSHQLLEVMAVGTPIITTSVGGNKEVIENGKEGILVEYNNKEAIKGAILSVLKSNNTDVMTGSAKDKLFLFKKEKIIKETINMLKNV